MKNIKIKTTCPKCNSPITYYSDQTRNIKCYGCLTLFSSHYSENMDFESYELRLQARPMIVTDHDDIISMDDYLDYDPSNYTLSLKGVWKILYLRAKKTHNVRIGYKSFAKLYRDGEFPKLLGTKKFTATPSIEWVDLAIELCIMKDERRTEEIL